PSTMEWIREGIASGNGTQIGRAAHKLKGTALAMGAQPIVDLTSMMEKDGFDGKLTNINDHFCELEHKVRDMLNSLAPNGSRHAPGEKSINTSP
ncbi:MAG: Hpt domain-containing protein, partial [Gemmataceae bacterium]